MSKRATKILYLLLAVLILTGCSMQTVDQLYRLPKRSTDYSDLQSAIDKAMGDLAFSAPLTGENQQSVQMADVDGDGLQEYLVFTKGSSELPLRILIFDRLDDVFVHTDTIKSNGSAFDQVEYIQMDEKPGVELIVGRQVSDQLVRSVSVYTFSGGEAEQLLSANYRKFVAVDFNENGRSELFVLRPSKVDTDNGVAEIYSMETGIMERSNEVSMSGPADQLKRVLVGRLHGGNVAVYVGSTVEDTALITDVFTQVDEKLTNVSLSNESGTSVQTLRNYYVYADDIDNDGIVELPRLITMHPLENAVDTERRDMILWYAIQQDGSTVDKLYTYFDSVGGWYLELDGHLAPRMSVQCLGNIYEFYLWNNSYSRAERLMSVYTLTGQNREEQSLMDGRFVLLKTDTVTYSASLDACAANYGITQESLIRDFFLVHQDWNTGEM